MADSWPGRPSVVANAEVVLQYLLKMLKEALGAFLAIGNEADGFAGKRAKPGCQFADCGSGFVTRIKYVI